MPVPAWVTVPVPLMALATVIESLRLKTSAALLVTELLPRLPDVPPLPICRVPVLIVVTPP